MRKKEIEDELRALEQEEKQENAASGGGASSKESIKPILVHHQSKDSASSAHHHHHHVHVEDDHADEQNLTPEELGRSLTLRFVERLSFVSFAERKKQFEMKRKKHYDEFRAARMADNEDDEPATTG